MKKLFLQDRRIFLRNLKELNEKIDYSVRIWGVYKNHEKYNKLQTTLLAWLCLNPHITKKCCVVGWLFFLLLLLLLLLFYVVIIVLLFFCCCCHVLVVFCLSLCVYVGRVGLLLNTGMITIHTIVVGH